MLTTFQLPELGIPLEMPEPIRANSGRVIAEGNFRVTVVSNEIRERFRSVANVDPEEFQLSTRIFDLTPDTRDEVIVQAGENRLPLIVRRDGEVILNFDLAASQGWKFPDSKRPIYTYIPGFNVHKVPALLRRPVSNVIQSFRLPQTNDVVREYSKLPLTNFECVLLLLRIIQEGPDAFVEGMFQWPEGKRAAFISLHDIDTIGFLQRRESDPLFQIERKHDIKATWFVPTKVLKGREHVDFLLKTGNEVGWHDHSHDHRLPYPPFATKRARILENSVLAEMSASERYPLGMRTPKLLKSNHLYEAVEKHSPTLSYDTSFLRGIVPYPIWTNGEPRRILEIPTTVPTDIRVYNQLSGVSGPRKYELMLQAQVARTKKLLEVGGVISIVTHPELDLSERPDLLELYDRYLAYIRTIPDLWIATAGQLFTHWTQGARRPLAAAV